MSDEARYKEYIAGVFDRAATEYDSVGVNFFRPAARELVARASLATGERVLDIGCGKGAVLIPAARAVGNAGRAVGIDISAEMVTAAREAVLKTGIPQATALLGDAENVPVAIGSFDVILAGLVLHFLADPQRAISEYIRFLRPGGRLVLSTPLPAKDGEDIIDRTALEALRPYLRKPVPARGRGQIHLTGSSLARLLRTLGMSNVQTVEASFPIEFSDADQYWRWKTSHGGRSLIEQIPDHLIESARRSLAEALTRVAKADGSLNLPMPVCYTSAMRE
ncbi:methyltransferase domain-containing protein (plasmid) [Streptomyces sp. NBC_00015]|uniref:class I SAM-dependent methyltransferase n=1 Tax=Streptomyces sp. NBC_00015 TaxID=2903611 RepID=UPI002F90C38F